MGTHTTADTLGTAQPCPGSPLWALLLSQEGSGGCIYALLVCLWVLTGVYVGLKWTQTLGNFSPEN